MCTSRTTAGRPGRPSWLGQVDDSAARSWTLVVHVGVVDLTDRLRATVSHPPLNFRQPSPTNGLPYMKIKLHPGLLREPGRPQGWLLFDAADGGGTTMVSAPMVNHGPSAGRLPCPAAERARSHVVEPTDAPEYRRTWWGLTTHNVFSVYRPMKVQSWAGRMTTAHGVRALVVGLSRPRFRLWSCGKTGSLSPRWCPLLVWRWRSRPAERGWDTPQGVSIRSLTPEQITNGFELKVWMLPDGVITIDVGGEKTVHTAIPGVAA